MRGLAIVLFAWALIATGIKIAIAQQPVSLAREINLDADIALQHGDRRVTLRPDELLDIIEHLKYEHFARTVGAEKRRAK